MTGNMAAESLLVHVVFAVTDAKFLHWVFMQRGIKRLNMTAFLTTDQSPFHNQYASIIIIL